MIPVEAYRGRTVAVLGLARTGLSAARALAAGGATVIGWDDDEGARRRARDAGLDVRDAAGFPWPDLAALVVSPGVPLHHPKPHDGVARARAAGVAVVGDLDLFAAARPGSRVIGITGTNGKSTTTALVGHLSAALGVPTAVGGNLGTPVLDLAPLPDDGLYVLELSSYGLDLAQDLRCAVGVLLNLSPDHLDRHGSMAAYVAAKRRLFAMQPEGATAVVGVDDAIGRETVALLRAEGRLRVVPVAVGDPLDDGVFAVDGRIIRAAGGRLLPIADLTGHPVLIGAHNAQNAAAAVATMLALGHEPAAITPALATFPGLPHRLETVATIDGVRFVNDSKATNADAAARALACFERVHWIIGGRPKAGGLAGTESLWPRVRRAYLIGEAAEAFAQQLGGQVGALRCGTLDAAVRRAACAARKDGPGAVVLLSPACASFDQFRDFEARGAAFRAAVAELGSGCTTGDAA
jgi:UDP-N-acetylmuramoylalanine--D-glutamate ligase